jgi:hypothetical protein
VRFTLATGCIAMKGSSGLLSIVLSVLSARAARADVSVFVGPQGGRGDVLVLDERGRSSWPAQLRGIVLLPLDCTGRTQLWELLPDHARRIDVPGAARLQLPQGQGSLYRYRRDDPAGGAAHFGFFVVDPEGRARVVLELDGSGARGEDDPLATRVAIAGRGDALLVATSLAAGGDLLEVDLVTGRHVNRTAELAPQAFRPRSLVLLADWGLALSATAPLRFSRTGNRQAEEVPLSPSWPAWLGEELVTSADESCAAAIAGSDPSSAFVHTFRAAGEAVRATLAPAHLSGAAFLPERLDGPALALSSDGSCLAWRTEGASRECWLREPAAGGPDVHLTGPAMFDDTLNDTGVIAFVDADSLVVLVGEDEGEGLEYADVYHVRFGPEGTLSVTNLTRTGPLTPPFDYGRLALEDGLHQLPGTPAWLALDRSDDPSRAAWLRFDASGDAPVELLSGISAPRVLEATAGELHACLPDELPGPGAKLQLFRLALDGLASSRWPLTGIGALERPVIGRASDEFAGVLVLAGEELLMRVEAAGEPRFIAPGSGLVFGPTLGFTRGTLHATVRHDDRWVVLSWSEAGFVLLRAGLAEGFVLPGS